LFWASSAAPPTASPAPDAGLRPLALLDGLAAFLPGVDPAVEVGDIGVAHLLQGVGRQRRAPARRAGEDDAAVRVEFRPVIGRLRVGVELEHPARSVYRARYASVLVQL